MLLQFLNSSGWNYKWLESARILNLLGTVHYLMTNSQIAFSLSQLDDYSNQPNVSLGSCIYLPTLLAIILAWLDLYISLVKIYDRRSKIGNQFLLKTKILYKDHNIQSLLFFTPKTNLQTSKTQH